MISILASCWNILKQFKIIRILEKQNPNQMNYYKTNNIHFEKPTMSLEN